MIIRSELAGVELDAPTIKSDKEVAIVTVTSAGYGDWLYKFLNSYSQNARASNEQVYVINVDYDPDSAEICRRFDAVEIPAESFRPIKPWVKSILYKSAHLVPEPTVICLDADMIVLNPLKPLVDLAKSIQGIAAVKDTWLVDANLRMRGVPITLADVWIRNYGGNNLEEVDLQAGSKYGGATEVINDGMLAGSHASIRSLGEEVDVLVKEYPQVLSRRLKYLNQFYGNYAGMRIAGGITMADEMFNYNVGTTYQKRTVQDGRMTVQLLSGEIREPLVTHFCAVRNKSSYPELQEFYARKTKP